MALPCLAMAQKNTGTAKGVIYDSLNDFALQEASVTIYKLSDSSIINFQLTNSLGEFEIKNLPIKTPLFYVATYTGYKAAHANFQIDSLTKVSDFKKIILAQRNKGELEEVVVIGVQPVRMNRDTLEINPQAFKLDSNAVVEDMLLRVPGLTVWGDGSITMNGRRVEKVMVDGKPFFGGATQTATQNLPKNAIEKIQLYQEKDYSKMRNTDEKTDSLYTMNIKLKADKKKGWFGKVGAGYGTDDRYTGDGVMQAYNKRTQAGVAIGINNINKEEGTGENAFQENTFKSNFRFFYGGRRNSGGITQRTYGNLKVQHNFSESENSQFFNRMTADYGYLNLSQNYIANTTNILNIDKYKQSNISSTKNTSDNTSNTVKFQYENRKQYGNFLTLNANYTRDYNSSTGTTKTDVLRNDKDVVSKSENINQSRSARDNLFIFGFVRSNDFEMKKDPRKNFMTNFNVGYNSGSSNSSVLNRFTSFIDTIASNTINRHYDNNSKNYNASVSVNYDGLRPLLFGIYNFFNINMSLINEVSISRSEQDIVVSDFDSLSGVYKPNAHLTNNNRVTNLFYNPGLGFSRSFQKSVWEKYNYWFNVSFDAKYQFLNQKNESSVLQRNMDRSFVFFVPRLSFNFNYQKNNLFRINSYLWASNYATPPSIDQLYPIIDSTNRYDVISGNPNLKAMKNTYANYNFEISRNKPNTKSNYGANIGLGLNNTKDAISDSSVYDASGRNIRYLINVKKQENYNGNLNLNFSAKLDKTSTLNFRYTTSFRHNIRPGYINGFSAISKNQTLSNGLTAMYNLIDKFNISIGQTISNNRSEQQSNKTITSSIINYTTNSNLNYFITKSITLNTSFDYQNNIAANGNSVKVGIWNASALYRFMQQKAELRLSAFDLLRQNKNIENFVRENSATTTITNGLQQYFMLTFSYYPRKFGGGGGSRGGVVSGVMIVK